MATGQGSRTWVGGCGRLPWPARKPPEPLSSYRKASPRYPGVTPLAFLDCGMGWNAA
jgi:hypothetical protein